MCTLGDLGFKTEEDPLEAEESQPLGSRVPLMSEDFEASKPSGTRTISSHSSVSSDSTAPLLPHHPLTHASPTPTPARVSFHHRIAYTDSKGDEDTEEDDEDENDEGQGFDDEGQGLDDEGHGLDDEGQGSKDEGPGMEEEEAAPEGQQQAILVVDTAASEPLGLGYGAARRRALESTKEIAPSTYEPTLVTWVDPKDGRVYINILTYAPPPVPVQTSSSLEWSLGSLLVSPSSLVVPSPIASPTATPEATISVDEDQFLEVGAQLELHGSILHDHTQRLDALPPTLFEGYDIDLRELYIRPVLALEAWAGQTNAQRAALWHAIYDIQRESPDLRRQLAEERHKRLELTDHVTRMDRRQEFGGGSRLYEILD
ncbi:hypothetical protein Tco_0848018 [Tanacetum coccineum]